jgi:3-dehydroquinate dehydratase/shikimate dehydrogenase
LKEAFERAAPLADLVELRLDCLEPSELDALSHPRELDALLRQSPRPLILTLRPSEQGGARSLDLDERAQLWTRLCQSASGTEETTAEEETTQDHFADLELDLLETLKQETLARLARRFVLICSHHDFKGVPPSLDEIYERMTKTPARIFKIAVLANVVADSLPIFRLLERARAERRELIAVAMGEAGIPTRILAPSRGAYLTYGSLDATQATAPGQLSAAQLRRIYRIDFIDEQTLITGLVGSPVAHSLSPHMHNAAFAACDVNAVYLPFEVRDAGDLMRRMVHPRTRELSWRLRGLSVTAPHKSAVIPHLDWIEASAREIGAVNTLVVEGDAVRGYNTDAAAALAPLEKLLTIGGARVAVLGAGGAARALLWALRERGAHATVFARDEARARSTARDFDAQSASLAAASFDGFDLVVNATPLGTRGRHENETPVSGVQLKGARLAYDLVYNPSETRFLREARAAGCATAGGLSMLVAQAAAQFKLWTGTDAPLETMREAAEAAMSEL